MPRAFFCLLCLLCLSVLSEAQCLRIFGSITDAYSGKAVQGAIIVYKTKGKQQILSETKVNGLYQIALPCDAQSVSVAAKGYRGQTIALHVIEKSQTGSFYLPVQLVAVDKQTIDQPYFQTAQHHVTLQKNNGGVGTSSVRMFETVDALTGKRIAAELCLFYTKTGTRDCQKIAAESIGYETVFRETDIVAIEVKSAGYQSYFGNLIMDKLDGKKSNYQIRLSRSINMLSVIVNSDSQEVTFQLAGAKPVALSSSDGIHFFTGILPDKNYTLQVKDRTGQTRAVKTFSSEEGINFCAMHVKALPEKQVTTSGKRLAILSGTFDTTKRILYFNKSDYQLTDENKLRLDSIAAWLGTDPAHYLKITGHTDNVGPANLNNTLSEYRARVTHRYLTEKGADPARMKYTGAGSNAPEAANDVESNKIKNRRVEIHLLRNP